MWFGYRNFLLFRLWVGARTAYNALFLFQLFLFHYLWLANKFYIILDRRSVNAAGTSNNLRFFSNLHLFFYGREYTWATFDRLWSRDSNSFFFHRWSVNASGTTINLRFFCNPLGLDRNRVYGWDWILESLCKIIIVEICLCLGKVKGLSNTLEGNNAAKE